MLICAPVYLRARVPASNDRILKMACTIADPDHIGSLKPADIAETTQCLSLDREGWLG